MRSSRMHQNTNCPNCGQLIQHADFTQPDHSLEADVHTNCDLTAWRHNGKQGPKPGTREYELAVGHQHQSRGTRNRAGRHDTTIAGPLTVHHPDGTTSLERPYTLNEQQRLARKAARQPRIHNEANTDYRRMK